MEPIIIFLILNIILTIVTFSLVIYKFYIENKNNLNTTNKLTSSSNSNKNFLMTDSDGNLNMMSYDDFRNNVIDSDINTRINTNNKNYVDKKDLYYYNNIMTDVNKKQEKGNYIKFGSPIAIRNFGPGCVNNQNNQEQRWLKNGCGESIEDKNGNFIPTALMSQSPEKEGIHENDSLWVLQPKGQYT